MKSHGMFTPRQEHNAVIDRKLKAAGRYNARIMDRDGHVVRETGWKPNLILDSGLAKIAHIPWACAFQWCVSGTGTTPTKVTTSSNASQSANTVSINSGTYTFTAESVGKLIYWPGSNKQAKITAFDSASTVTVDRSQTVTDAEFVIYNVDQTTLVAPYSMNMRYETTSGLCGTSITGSSVKMWRTFDFYVEFSPVLITELGFTDRPNSPALFSRVLLPASLYLHAGQYLQVSYELTVNLEPSTPLAKTAVITGWPIAPSTSLEGDEAIQSIGMAIVGEDGVARPYDQSMLCNEPFVPGSSLVGPGLGYCNRWKNAAGSSPLKLYANNNQCPFIMHVAPPEGYLTQSRRYYKYLYEISHTGAYVDPTIIPQPASQGGFPYTGDYAWNHAVSTPAPTYYTLADLMVPVISPKGYSAFNGASDPARADWAGIDPYVDFPDIPPVAGVDTAWFKWWWDFTNNNETGIAKQEVTGASAFLSSVSTAHASAGTCVDRSEQCIEVPLVVEPYVAGSQKLVKKATFLTNIGNRSDWRVLGIGPTDTSIDIVVRTAAAKYNGFAFIFDQTQTKLSTHVLNAYFQYSWDRDLTNA